MDNNIGVDRISQLMMQKYPEGLRIGDPIKVKGDPIYSHLNPSEGVAIFFVNSPHKKDIIYYPITSPIFDFMSIPFYYERPNKNLLASKFKVLKDPYYDLEVDRDFEKNGLVHIVGKNYGIDKGGAKGRGVHIKTIRTEKSFLKFLEYEGPINVDDDSFSGYLVSFLKYPNIKTSKELIEKKIDEFLLHDVVIDVHFSNENFIDGIDNLEIKMITNSGTYIDIQLKLIMNA